MTIFMTAEQKPFFAGTYFPPETRQGMMGFSELLLAVEERWKNDRESLFSTGEQVCSALNQTGKPEGERVQSEMIEKAVQELSGSFDARWGGFGEAPKFPTAHNLLFLMLFWKMKGSQSSEEGIPAMMEKTLEAMARGGIFDQIGYGFSRYSTDRFFLVPHFEKMLYDNALLMIAYTMAYQVFGKKLYLDTAEKTTQYLFREMRDAGGGFYSAQDADSDGEEGKFYLWDYEEICSVLGEDRGKAFCDYYGVSKSGNFAGKNIPNLLNGNDMTEEFNDEIQILYEYRRKRGLLHLDDKILTAWNGLAVCALGLLYRASGKKQYLHAAEKAADFIEKNLSDGALLYVGFRDKKHFVPGFLEEYSYYTAGLLTLYDVTSDKKYLDRALEICGEAHRQFADEEQGGYFLYGMHNSRLIVRPKETYDGAMPSGNSVMAYCLVRLARITGEEEYRERAERQLAWMSGEAEQYPSGHCFFLMALLLQEVSEEKITVVLGEEDRAEEILRRLPLFVEVHVLPQETQEYQLLNGKTTYYICKDHTCLPPSNEYLMI